jgi:hypothetical protein
LVFPEKETFAERKSGWHSLINKSQGSWHVPLFLLDSTGEKCREKPRSMNLRR